MQDIWGFRIILDDVAAVNTVRDLIKTKKHFWWCSEKNYITLPKSSWYRGVHLIFTKKYSKQDVALKIELQIRTKLQHYRATAVETVWVHLSQPLKSSQWDEKRLSYFSLASAVFSLSENSTLPKEYTKVNILDLLRDFHRQTKKLKVVATLKWFALAQEIIKRELKKHKNQKDNELFLITINAKQDQLSINSYSQRDAELANSKYLEKETDNTDPDVYIVLVWAESTKELIRSYPNFFSDTHKFIEKVENIIDKIKDY